MTVSRHSARNRPSLLVALFMAMGILARVLLPMPAAASTQATLSASLAAIGAVICHTDDGTPDPGPSDASSCDRCEICTISSNLPLLPPAVAAGIVFPSSTDAAPPFQRDSVGAARAPPERANPPRGPPTV